MKKLCVFLLFAVMVLNGLGAGVIATTNNEACVTSIYQLSEPKLSSFEEYLEVGVAEATTQLLDAGKPILPVFVYNYQFPLGTGIENIAVQVHSRSYILDKKILPTPSIGIYSVLSQEKSVISPDISVYEQIGPYPSQVYSVSDTCGLMSGERCRSISIRVFPQYYPLEDRIEIPNLITITIDYLPPQNPAEVRDEYDLLIITDEKFVSGLEPLVVHKAQMGVDAIIDTTQNIYPTYEGRDAAEDIKLRIKDAVENWGISYVLLAGGRKGQSFDWYVPERRTHNDDGWEGGYASDLYFGDIYKIEENETVFEDWDSNGNGIFAEWGGIGGNRDYIDYNPDVYVGRLPFRYKFEVNTVVNKIITYETSASDSWFKTGLAIGGDTGPPCRGPATPGIYEGEISTGMSAAFLESIGFSMDRLFLSEGAWDGREDIVRAISDGCGFIDMAGHGNPAYWGNFLPDAESEEEMVDGLLLWDMPKLSNREKLPFVVVGGCHNAQFNVTFRNFVKDFREYGLRGMFLEPPFRFFYNEWVPRDFCSGLVFARRGGAIGSIGCTGLGLGYFNTVGLSDWLNVQFFDAYANQSKEILGEAHGTALQDYIVIQGGVNSNQGDRKTVEEWALIGDPSLMLGGY